MASRGTGRVLLTKGVALCVVTVVGVVVVALVVVVMVVVVHRSKYCM